MIAARGELLAAVLATALLTLPAAHGQEEAAAPVEAPATAVDPAAVALGQQLDTSAPLTVDDCVAIALSTNAQIAQAESRVDEYTARMREVQSIFYPKIMGLGLIAPMFGVDATFDSNGQIQSYSREYGISHWGPYFHIEAILAQPFYTFGRARAGKRAASAYVDVQQARVRETESVVALEVRKFYYTHLYASAMLPSLDYASEILTTAAEEAQKMYDAATGDVTKVDLMKLEYAASELAKMQLMAAQGADLSLSALKHTMGLPESTVIELADAKLPKLPGEPGIEPLPDLILAASVQRPEWAMLASGKEATLAWEQAERLADAPVLAVAGQVKADWAPSRSDADNPYYQDIYNGATGGVGLAVQFNIDPAKSRARADIAEFTGDQVEAMERFASTGLPLQLKKAHSDVEHYHQMTDLSIDGAKATRKWMTFAAAAYATGTGETQDLLEGIGAYMKAKASHYENLSKYHIACAELQFAVGE